jgi:hypothetical protein
MRDTRVEGSSRDWHRIDWRNSQTLTDCALVRVGGVRATGLRKAVNQHHIPAAMIRVTNFPCPEDLIVCSACQYVERALAQ